MCAKPKLLFGLGVVIKDDVPRNANAFAKVWNILIVLKPVFLYIWRDTCRQS